MFSIDFTVTYLWYDILTYVWAHFSFQSLFKASIKLCYYLLGLFGQSVQFSQSNLYSFSDSFMISIIKLLLRKYKDSEESL